MRLRFTPLVRLADVSVAYAFNQHRAIRVKAPCLCNGFCLGGCDAARALGVRAADRIVSLRTALDEYFVGHSDALGLNVGQGQQVVSLATVYDGLHVLDASVAVNVNPGSSEVRVAVRAPNGLIAVRFNVRNHLLSRAITALRSLLVAYTFDPPKVADVLMARATAHALANAFEGRSLGNSGHFDPLEIATEAAEEKISALPLGM